MTPRVLRLGTRGSALARWQSRHVADRLGAVDPALEIREMVLQTEGDAQQERPFGPLDTRGVFVRRIEEALLAGEIDFAVHSLKDLPTSEPTGLVIAAVPARHDPRDALLTRAGARFEELPDGVVLATSSLRRRCQLKAARPGVETAPVRGNVDTRVRKLVEGRFDGVVLALAGVERLGIRDVPVRPIELDVCLPAVGQGALAIQTRSADTATRDLVGALAHADSESAVRAERAFLRVLGGGCLAPAAALATVRERTLRLRAVVGDPDGVDLLRGEIDAPREDADKAGEDLARRLLARGAGEILRRVRERAAGGA